MTPTHATATASRHGSESAPVKEIGIRSMTRRPWYAPLLATGDDGAATILRLTLALVFFPHGAQKLLGWFGGPGFAGEMEILTGMVGLPVIVALLVILIEFFAPIALAAGFLTRPAALGIGAVMVGAVSVEHFRHGFFMNWFGQQAGEGFEYHLLVIGIVLALLVKGGGALSVDRRTSFPRGSISRKPSTSSIR